MPFMRTLAQHYQEPTLKDLMREIQQLQYRVGEVEERSRDSPRSVHSDVKIDLPEFEGRREPDEFLEWLQTVERIFEYKEVPEERRVKLVAIKLKRGASLWWENLKRARLREGRSKIVTWAKMSRELQREYLPIHYRQDRFLRLHQQQKRASLPAVTPDSGFTAPPAPRLPVVAVDPKTPDVRKSDRGSVSATSPAQKCLKCHGFGHIASKCPTENHIFFTEEGEAVEIEEKEEQTLDEELFEESQLHADEGEPLMLQKEKFLHAESIMEPEFEEKECGLFPPHQPTVLTHLATSHREVTQWEDTVVKRVLLVLVEADSYGMESDTIPSMILPTEPQKEQSQILNSSNRHSQQEFKYMAPPHVPKLDLFWVKVKGRKVSLSSLSKLELVQMLLHSSMDYTSRQLRHLRHIQRRRLDSLPRRR